MTTQTGRTGPMTTATTDGTRTEAEIRAELGSLAPLPSQGPVGSAEMIRYLLVRASARYHLMLETAFGPDGQAAMCAEFAAAVAFRELEEIAGPQTASRLAQSVRDAWADGGTLGERAWSLLGAGLSGRVQELACELGDSTQPEIGYSQLHGKLRDRIDAALQDSMDSCARCKACDAQVDAVMAVLAAEAAPVPSAAIEALTRLASDQVIFTERDLVDAPDPLTAERKARSEFAARALEALGSPAAAGVPPAAAVTALRALASDEPMTDLKPGNHAYLALRAEMDARREFAAAALAACREANPVPSEPVMELLESAWKLVCDITSSAMPVPPGWVEKAGTWQARYWDLVREYAASKAGRQAAEADEPAPEPVPSLPPGDYGRIEIPGFRNHVGWWTEGLMAGQPVMVCSDRDGKVLARYIPGPGFRFVDLEVPSATVRQEDRPALGWSGDRDDDPDLYVAHARGCNDPNCNGDCIPF